MPPAYALQHEGIQAQANELTRGEWERLAAYWRAVDGAVPSGKAKARVARFRRYAALTVRAEPRVRAVKDVYGGDVTHNRRPHREAPREPVLALGDLPVL